jgi:hypothetical protein
MTTYKRFKADWESKTLREIRAMTGNELEVEISIAMRNDRDDVLGIFLAEARRRDNEALAARPSHSRRNWRPLGLLREAEDLINA